MKLSKRILLAAFVVSSPIGALAFQPNPAIEVNLGVLSYLTPETHPSPVYRNKRMGRVSVPVPPAPQPVLVQPDYTPPPSNYIPPPQAYAPAPVEPVEEESQLNKALNGQFSGNISIVSDYSFRGVSQTREAPAVQGGIDFAHNSGLTAGVWGSNIDFGPGTDGSAEIDVYASYTHEMGDASAEGGVFYYTYPGADSKLNYDYLEVYGSLGYDFGIASVAAALYYSPEFFGESGEAYYPQLSAEAPLPYGFTLDGWIGRQYIDDNATFALPDYTDWSLGLAYELEGFTIKAQYVDTNLDKTECADGCDAKGIVSISKSIE